MIRILTICSLTIRRPIELETLHYSLMKAHATLNRRVLARAAGLGLTPGQPKVLDYLIDHEGHDQKTIAAYCEIEPATVGSILLGMEDAGLIVRRQHPGNRRSLFVYLTEKGRAAAEAMAEVFAEMEAQATRSFSPEETETLRTLLNRMCADAQAAEQGAQGV